MLLSAPHLRARTTFATKQEVEGVMQVVAQHE
jgi:hypothetical protein